MQHQVKPQRALRRRGAPLLFTLKRSVGWQLTSRRALAERGPTQATRGASVLVVLAAALALVTISPSFANAASSAPTLTGQGRLVRDLEGLLHKTFGNKSVWTTNGNDFACAGSSCVPLAKYSPYFYIFQTSTNTPFVLSTHHFAQVSFGNYPYQILVKGESVACNARHTSYLIAYSDAEGLALACLAPAHD
jgi:hypothetical protein